MPGDISWSSTPDKYMSLPPMDKGRQRRVKNHLKLVYESLNIDVWKRAVARFTPLNSCLDGRGNGGGSDSNSKMVSLRRFSWFFSLPTIPTIILVSYFVRESLCCTTMPYLWECLLLKVIQGCGAIFRWLLLGSTWHQRI